MRPQAEILAQYEMATSRQRDAAEHLRGFYNAGLPLLAESYERECRYLGVVILSCVDELRALDPKYSAK